tara:strand:- start:1118 stop:1975 length:858 start_codon:yes stop_codon:yes gene_type:complete
MTPINYNELTPELTSSGCFVSDMPNEVYHALPGISKSGLDKVDISPAHYAYAEPNKSTRAMEIGTAIHSAVLEPELFKVDYMLLKDVHDRRSSEYKQAVKALGSGEKVLTGTEADRVTGMQLSAEGNEQWAAMTSRDHYSELSALVQCPKTGVLLRARFDHIGFDGVAVDLKKTQDARYESFQKSVANYRYHVQDAFYSYVYELVTGKPLEAFWFLAIEENAPNTCKLYRLDDEARAIGRRQFMANLEAYAEADKTGDWVTYDTTAELMSLPAWALDEDDEGVEL